ncbi:MAG: preprotein translocase subunit SecA [Bacteroidota bacterium]
MFDFLKKVFPSKKEKDLKSLMPVVDAVNEHYEGLDRLSDDELRGKTAEFKQHIAAYTEEIKAEIDALKAEAEQESDIDEKEKIFEQIDALDKDYVAQLDEVLSDLMSEVFAVVKETARRFAENGELRVTANEMDRELAAEKDHIVIKGNEAIWKGEWEAAGATVNWNMVHYDVQLIGGSVLHNGKIAEMATGEGKTLVATLPVYLNALAGKGVHVVTVNNYLARRDAEWNAPIFQFHGLTVDCIDLHQPNSEDRRQAYLADITYGTNNEFGFDYLRDNMTTHPEYLVQREHFYAIIDEIDSVLIDEARTPLIISGPVDKGEQQEYEQLKPRIERLERKQRELVSRYMVEAKKKIGSGDKKAEEEGALALFRAYRGLPKHNKLIEFLSETGIKAILQKTEAFYMQDNSKNMHLADDELYFTIDQKNNQVQMTDKGRELITKQGEEKNLFVLPDVAALFSEIEGSEELSDDEKLQQKDDLAREYADKAERLHAINQLLKAYTLFERDVEYIIQEGKVMIVDEQTGRVLAGRRYSDGLHQAIEAKENVKVEAATQTFATVTLQNYFRMYHKLSGMTGTAETEEAEFFEIYKLDVVIIPTNRPIARDDREDLVFKTRKEKYMAVIEEIENLRGAKRPVLVGTTSVEVSELLSRMLNRQGIEHNVLNAKQHQREAEVVAEAGQPGTVTIATNMAGRGTDIKLGQGVEANGGLAIIGTERHESRRVDRQLRGRAGRQGDNGSSQFYVSLEDDLMRLFGSERIAKIMDRLGLKEGEVIQHGMITKSIGNAQKKVEENNFSMRKRLLEYDDVMNSQREVIYRRRRNALYGDRIKIDLDNMLYDLCGTIAQDYYEFADGEGLSLECIRMLAIDPRISDAELNDMKEEEIQERIYEQAQAFYQRKVKALSSELHGGITRLKKEYPQMERVVIPFSDGSNKLQILVNVEDALTSDGRIVVDELEKAITLNLIDDKWKHHLREMDELRQSAQNAVFEQKDPLLVYKFESFALFQQMLTTINRQVLSTLFKADLQVGDRQQEPTKTKRDDFSKLKARHDSVERERKAQAEEERRIMAGASAGGDDRPMSRKQRRAQERRQTGSRKRSLPKSR